MIVTEADAATMKSYPAYEFAEGIFRPLTDELGGFVVGGTENLRSVDGQGYIVAPKHISNWDHFVLGRAMIELPYSSQRENPDMPPLQPRGLHWMAKEELWRYPVVKQFVDLCNAFPVERGTGKGLPQHLVEHIGKVLDNNAVLVMYPEGHRYKELDRANLHSTVARLALLYGVPVVPAGIAGPAKGPKWPRAIYFEEPIFRGQMDPESPDFQVAKEAFMDDIYEGMGSGFERAKELHAQMNPGPNLLRTLNQLTSSPMAKVAVAGLGSLAWNASNRLMQ